MRGPRHRTWAKNTCSTLVKRMPDGGAGGRVEVLTIHEDADVEAFRLLEKIRREHKRVREIQAYRLKFDAVQNRPVALIAIGDSSAKWVGMSPMLERRWVLRDDFEALAVKHPEIFVDIGGICSADQVIAARDICAVLSDWRQAVNVMQSDHPEFWSASAYLPIMTTLKAGMSRTRFKVFSATDPSPRLRSHWRRCTRLRGGFWTR